MSLSGPNIVPQEQASSYALELDHLQCLLQKQLVLIQRGDWGNFETLSKETDAVIARIIKTGIVKSDEFKKRREKLQQIYHQLCLTVATQKDAVGKELGRIRKGKKVLKTYSGNI